MPLAAGQELQERYRIDALLGQGGMGAVYLAVDMRFGERVAIKENRTATPEAHKQFGREAHFLYRLRHPNLPRVIDYFTLPGQGQYLVMDYVGGEDLQTLLTRREGLSEAESIGYIHQVLSALMYLHSQNVIHRDVKPANIKITPQGALFLVDFGLAKTYDSILLTTTGARGVTPGYAPPEQYGQGHTDARSDVYSAGATLYALLTGRRPPDSVDVVMGTQVLVPPRHLNPRISPRTEDAVLRAMQCQPGDRFQSVADLRAALSAPGRTETRQAPSNHARSAAGPSPGVGPRQVKAPYSGPKRAPSPNPPDPVIESPEWWQADKVSQLALVVVMWLAWIVASALGYALGRQIGRVFGEWGGDPFRWPPYFAYQTLGVAIAGVGQWVVLRRVHNHALYWLGASVVTGVIGVAVAAWSGTASAVEILSSLHPWVPEMALLSTILGADVAAYYRILSLRFRHVGWWLFAVGVTLYASAWSGRQPPSWYGLVYGMVTGAILFTAAWRRGAVRPAAQ